MKENKNTTFIGLGALATVIAGVLTAMGNGEAINWLQVIPGVLAAVGLIFAKDANKN